jgi:hypothetical protein
VLFVPGNSKPFAPQMRQNLRKHNEQYTHEAKPLTGFILALIDYDYL